RKNPYILKRIRAVDADIWVLTETNAAIDLSGTHNAVVSASVATLHKAGENWTTIWSRYPITSQPKPYGPSIAVCAESDITGKPWLVYGTVLPWHSDKGQSGTAPGWTEHYRVIPLQGKDWNLMRAAFPSHRFCVAGDLNQSRDGLVWPWGREYYGTKKGRALLTDELNIAGIKCVTEANLFSKGLKTRSSIDHVCVDLDSARRIKAVRAWEAGCGNGKPLSDHNGIYADLAF